MFVAGGRPSGGGVDPHCSAWLSASLVQRASSRRAARVSGVLGTDHSLEDRRRARSSSLTALMAKTIAGSAGTQGGARPIPRVASRPGSSRALYLAAACVLTRRLWADPAARADHRRQRHLPRRRPFASFLRYDATAVAHGMLPALRHDRARRARGINLMWTPRAAAGGRARPGDAAGRPQVTLAILLVWPSRALRPACSWFCGARGPASPRRRWAVRCSASPRRCG